ncbi:hypothetical protein N7532_001314 [Penicillium argentinense]|uniref:Btz domain-containing protein n=1 Tax=Penicillium argentinense TaxID=1131581 RepID=A0A9W9G291_9EURO|nr:uncharacterized protein N7532_001314 [Penicillium argentinense]KAJ5110779.1 hypothetical protein N7532_001314 [Penicillium argentinense]
MAPRRRHIGASRRKRREDEGEEEGSIVGDLEDDSLSEGSVDSHPGDEDADVEGSEDEDIQVTKQPGKSNPRKPNGREHEHPKRRNAASPNKPGLKTTVSDTEAMLNGLKITDEGEEVPFDQLEEDRELQTGRTPSAPPTEPKRETFAAKKRREHDKYVKERDQNPAFVPTRGRFFLHDNRTTEAGSNGHRSSNNKGKSRPVGLIVDGNSRRNSAKTDASEGKWDHDLHATVAGDEPSAPKHSATSTVPNPPSNVPTAPRSSPPNRSFSSTTLVGNVPVVVFLPGMAQAKSFASVPKKQHTRLPQHRPPLRRDKPVRISLPGQSPRYIFPSTERSFIFIPRALRPNQQGYRGRGRGGFYPGRRPSYYPSTYTPSIASRRSSFGMSQDGYPSPAGSAYSRPSMAHPDVGKPVVRLPPPPRPPVGIPPVGPAAGIPGPMPMPSMLPPYRESRPAPIPMHQPRPQKTVSVAGIETPASFHFNPPQPQQEQPFHHQVPVPVVGPGQESVAHGPSSQGSGTPLSQIPERAVHADTFHPGSYQQPTGYYPNYPPGAMYYPGYNGPMGPGASVPNFAPGQQPMPYVLPHTSNDQSRHPETVAHESGGTVYFYDSNQMYQNPNTYGSGPGGVVGMGGMMTPPGTTFYYPQAPTTGGMYYGHQ